MDFELQGLTLFKGKRMNSTILDNSGSDTGNIPKSKMPSRTKTGTLDVERFQKQSLKKHTRPQLSKIIRKTAQVTMTLPFVVAPPEESEENISSLVIPEDLSKDEALTKVEEFLRGKQPRRATKYLEHAGSKGIDTHLECKLWTDIGNLCYDLRFLDDTKSAFSHAHKHKPDLVATLFNLGLAHHMLGNLDQAQNLYREACQRDEVQSKIWCNLGVVHFQLEDLKEAEKSTRKAIEIRPNYVRAWDNLAALLGSVDRIPECLDACFSAIAFDEKCCEAWFKVGMIYFEQEKYELAKNALTKAGELQDLESYTLYIQGIMAVRVKKLNEGFELCKKAQEKDEFCELGPPAWSELQEAFDQAGHDVLMRQAGATADRLHDLIKKKAHPAQN